MQGCFPNGTPPWPGGSEGGGPGGTGGIGGIGGGGPTWPGLGVPHLRHLLLYANAWSPHEEHVQSPARGTLPWPCW